MTRCIQKVGKYYYLVSDSRKDGKLKRKYIRSATQAEIETYEENKKAKEKLIKVSCAYPHCDKLIIMSRAQKQKFFTTYPMRYGRLNLPYCSKKCQETHFKELQSDKSKIKVI